MKESRTVRPYGIPVGVDNIRIDWSTELLNENLSLRKIVNERRKSTVVLSTRMKGIFKTMQTTKLSGL